MKTNYVLIDFENVQVKSLELLTGEHFNVRVFLGPTNKKIPIDLVVAMQRLGTRADYITLETSGANALDFHIAYYLGRLTTDDQAGFFHIISKDTGFDPLIRHLKVKGILCARSSSIEEMPCFNSSIVLAAQKSVTTVELPQPENSKSAPPSSESRVPKADASSGVEEAAIEKLIKSVVDDLIKRKNAKPRTPKALMGTIHARCGKQIPAAEIDAVYDALVMREYVKIDGAKVTYALPGH